MMNPVTVRLLAKRKPKETARAFCKNLREWYPSLTVEEVEKAMQEVLAGRLNEEDVIQVIINKWFTEGVAQ